jgi:hypothetical protein
MNMKGTEVGRIWVFDATTLEQALARYQAEAEQAYPHQQEKIGIAVAAIRDFLHSPAADAMIMNKGRD